MSALNGLTPHQRRALAHLARLPPGPWGLVRCREVGEPAARALTQRGLTERHVHEHIRKTPRGNGWRLQFFHIEQIRLTSEGRSAALEIAP